MCVRTDKHNTLKNGEERSEIISSGYPDADGGLGSYTAEDIGSVQLTGVGS